MWERDYNLKVPLKPTVGLLVPGTEEYSTFDNFFLVDKHVAHFEATLLID